MSFILSIKDTYRQAVEAATGGKNTVMYDDKGNPSIMVCIPRFNLSDVIDGAPDVPHPAFIVNGVVKSEIWISKYQNIVHDNRAYSLPAMDPKALVNFDQAKQYCENKGSGWHLMTNAEWAAVALWSKKNGTMPRGNNYHGKDHSALHESGRVTYTYTFDGIDDVEYIGRVATGSAPISWSHDGTNAGIFDLNGNVWEWVDGVRIEDGKIYVHKDNDFNTPTDDLAQWIDTGVFFDVQDRKLVLNSSRTTKMNEEINEYKDIAIEQLKGATGFTVPDLLKYLAIAPTEGDHGWDRIFNSNYGSRFTRRGGFWANGISAGVFSFDTICDRSYSYDNTGFRAAWVSSD